MKLLYLTFFLGIISVSTNSFAQYQKVTVANCAPPSAQITLEINNVRARLLTGGDMFRSIGVGLHGYEVPKGSNINSITAGALWISAKDAGGNLHTAGQTYRQRGLDFWPGPLNNNGEVDSSTCKTWDRFFSVKGDAIRSTINGQGIDSSILNWPGSLAPFMDIDFDGVYDPTKGDYPVYDINVPSNIPSEMIWWVMNDAGNAHTAYLSGLPLGIEIQATAFAYQSSTIQSIQNSTMYRYRIVNKSSSPLYDVTVGQFLDTDIGYDEYVGCDISRVKGVFYCYDADPFDSKFGANSPAIGITYLKTFRDESGNNLPISSFMFMNGNGVVGLNTDPMNSVELDRYLNAYWPDGATLSYGTPNGRGGTIQTYYAFSGNLYSQLSWTETDVPGDRKILPAIGPFSLQPGAINEVVFSILWAKSDTGGNRGSVAKLLANADTIQIAAASNFSAFSTGLNDSKYFKFNVFPNPIFEKCWIDIPVKNNESIQVKVYTMQGKLLINKNFDPTKKIELDVNTLNSGTYIINVQQGANTSSLKILK